MKSEQIQKEYEQMKKKLSRLNYICAGSVMLLYRKCGKSNCACQEDKEAEHGPYYIWTRKVMGKTVTRTLSDKRAKQCQDYIDNLKAVEPILDKMKSLAAKLIELP